METRRREAGEEESRVRVTERTRTDALSYCRVITKCLISASRALVWTHSLVPDDFSTEAVKTCKFSRVWVHLPMFGSIFHRARWFAGAVLLVMSWVGVSEPAGLGGQGTMTNQILVLQNPRAIEAGKDLQDCQVISLIYGVPSPSHLP